VEAYRPKDNDLLLLLPLHPIFHTHMRPKHTHSAFIMLCTPSPRSRTVTRTMFDLKLTLFLFPVTPLPFSHSTSPLYIPSLTIISSTTSTIAQRTTLFPRLLRHTDTHQINWIYKTSYRSTRTTQKLPELSLPTHQKVAIDPHQHQQHRSAIVEQHCISNKTDQTLVTAFTP
jgi:hypothetical protein